MVRDRNRVSMGARLNQNGSVKNQPLRRTFVLVHGAWHGGWCWKYVREILELAGHRVYTPTLTGLAQNSHLQSREVDLNTHIQDIVNLFLWEELEDVTLVCHSYGGWVCSGALESIKNRVTSLVFVDAFLPEDGGRGYDMHTPARQMELDRMRADGAIGHNAPSAEDFGVKSPDNISWVNEKMTAQPIAATFSTVKLSGAREKVAKKLYIRALGFPQPHLDEYYEKTKADATWDTYGVPGDVAGHDIMVDAPKMLADLIEQAAAQRPA